MLQFRTLPKVAEGFRTAVSKLEMLTEVEAQFAADLCIVRTRLSAEYLFGRTFGVVMNECLNFVVIDILWT